LELHALLTSTLDAVEQPSAYFDLFPKGRDHSMSVGENGWMFRTFLEVTVNREITAPAENEVTLSPSQY
jgi:hypothetical protein